MILISYPFSLHVYTSYIQKPYSATFNNSLRQRTIDIDDLR